MTSFEVVELAKQTLMLVLMISAPILIAATLVGVVVSLGQVVTSMQDMTLSTVPRLLAVAAATAATLPWMLRHMVQFTTELFGHLERWAR